MQHGFFSPPAVRQGGTATGASPLVSSNQETEYGPTPPVMTAQIIPGSPGQTESAKISTAGLSRGVTTNSVIFSACAWPTKHAKSMTIAADVMAVLRRCI